MGGKKVLVSRPLVTGSSKVECAEDNLPGKIHGVPEFRVV